jgi:hypothetical protein
MKRRYALGLALILTIALNVYNYRAKADEKPIDYLKAIDIIYNADIIGMSVVAGKTSGLSIYDVYTFLGEAANRADKFSADTQAGVKLWEGKQLFLSIKDLKVLREGPPAAFEKPGSEYYLVQTNQDFDGRKAPTGLHHLILFVNTENYRIYRPKTYYPYKLPDSSTRFVEYEGNEITKKLVNDLVKR